MAAWKTISVPLDYPIEADGRTVAVLVFREPSAEALEIIDELRLAEGKQPSVRQLLAVAAALCVPAEDGPLVRQIHYTDLRRVSEQIVPLLTLSSSPAGSKA